MLPIYLSIFNAGRSSKEYDFCMNFAWGWYIQHFGLIKLANNVVFTYR